MDILHSANKLSSLLIVVLTLNFSFLVVAVTVMAIPCESM